MVLDIMLGISIIFSILLGLRDGMVRKLVAILFMLIALFAGQFLQHDIGSFLTDTLSFDPATAPMIGYLLVFTGLMILQMLLYRFVARKYKIGGVADRIFGCMLGWAEGMLLLSSLLFILLPTGFPSEDFSEDARFYKSIVNIAPQVLDIQSSWNTDAPAAPDTKQPKKETPQHVNKK